MDIIAVILLVIMWILPGIIASMRDHHNEMAIWVLTLIGSWTIGGWIIALVWAFTEVKSKGSSYKK